MKFTSTKMLLTSIQNNDLLDSFSCFRLGNLHLAREADGYAAAGEQKDRSET